MFIIFVGENCFLRRFEVQNKNNKLFKNSKKRREKKQLIIKLKKKRIILNFPNIT